MMQGLILIEILTSPCKIISVVRVKNIIEQHHQVLFDFHDILCILCKKKNSIDCYHEKFDVLGIWRTSYDI
jgi:hypothetical protein